MCFLHPPQVRYDLKRWKSLLFPSWCRKEKTEKRNNSRKEEPGCPQFSLSLTHSLSLSFSLSFSHTYTLSHSLSFRFHLLGLAAASIFQMRGKEAKKAPLVLLSRGKERTAAAAAAVFATPLQSFLCVPCMPPSFHAGPRRRASEREEMDLCGWFLSERTRSISICGEWMRGEDRETREAQSKKKPGWKMYSLASCFVAHFWHNTTSKRRGKQFLLNP